MYRDYQLKRKRIHGNDVCVRMVESKRLFPTLFSKLSVILYQCIDNNKKTLSLLSLLSL